jgi:hypothetical protein
MGQPVDVTTSIKYQCPLVLVGINIRVVISPSPVLISRMKSKIFEKVITDSDCSTTNSSDET